jgi:hypothetical protein
MPWLGPPPDTSPTACASATLVNYGRMSGEPCGVQPDALVFRDLTLRGFWLARWFQRAPEEGRRAIVGEIAGLIASGKLHAPIQATYDVSEIKDAVAAAATDGRSGQDPHRPATLSSGASLLGSRARAAAVPPRLPTSTRNVAYRRVLAFPAASHPW